MKQALNYEEKSLESQLIKYKLRKGLTLIIRLKKFCYCPEKSGKWVSIL